jgi:hypothetical protein
MDLNFVDFLSYITLLIIWCTISVLSLAIYFCSAKESDNWDKVYDKCKENTAKYQYIVRFIFGVMRKGFQIKQTTITVDILKKDSILVTRFTITPKQMEKFVIKPDALNQKMVRFFLLRSEPLSNIVNVVINHNGLGTIFVNNIEIQEIKSIEANIAYVGQNISKLANDKALIKQIFPSGSKEIRAIEASLTYSQLLNGLEFLVFIFTAINEILFICVFLIPCNEENTKFCDDYRDGLFSSAFSGLASSTIAALTFIVLVTIYRYLIKRGYAKAFGGGLSSCVRISYILFVIIIGIIIGGYAAFCASAKNKFKSKNSAQSYDHEVFWMFAVGIGVIIFLMIWLSALSIVAYLIGFFGSDVDLIKAKDSNPLKVSETIRSSSQESIGDDYHKQLTANIKVKSISQYQGIQKSTQNESSKSQTSKKVSKTPSQESTGDHYYQQLMSKGQGKVKSVSQYRGVQQ